MKPPICSRCDEPCLTIYSASGRRKWNAPMGYAETFYHGDDPRIIWLCADCVDEVAEALA